MNDTKLSMKCEGKFPMSRIWVFSNIVGKSVLVSSSFCYFHLHVCRMATIYLSYGIEQHPCHNSPTIHTQVSQSPISIPAADDRVMIFLKANFGIKEIADFKRKVHIYKVMWGQDKHATFAITFSSWHGRRMTHG